MTFSKPPFLPCRAIKITSTLTERGSFLNCSLIFPRISLSLVRTCNKLGEGRVFLNSSKASSEFNSLIVSAMATNSCARVALASSCSFALVLQSSAKPDKKVSSAPLEVSVSLRSFFSTVICTARSPARAVLSSMASVAAAISLFLAWIMPLWDSTASFSAFVISARFASISSFIVLRIPTICPEAGAYSVCPCRNACRSDFCPSVSCIDASAMRLMTLALPVCRKAPAIPFSMAGIA
mmetsp:Transcript_32791/g.78969  ORF Transcript_32791/g.78969 Transcript_32791/m.78969 type:complete len:238 (+) Transcript_32791:1022-1735(+)